MATIPAGLQQITQNVNLGQISTATTAAAALGALVLVSPASTVGYQPLNPKASALSVVGASPLANPPSLLFHYEGENSVTLSSDITDHYVEDNTAVQDQIALKPPKITVRGFIGELNDVAPFGLQTLQSVSQKLTAVEAFAPAVTATGLLAYQEAFFGYQTLATLANAAISAWSSIAGGQAVVDASGNLVTPNFSYQNKQQTMFQLLYGYWQGRYLFNIQTPWVVFTNMAIENLRAVQDEITNVISDFEITFKQIRTTNSTISKIQSIGRSVSQASPSQNSGTTSGTPAGDVSSQVA